MEFYTVEEVSKILRVSKRTVYRWVHGGKINCVRVGKKILIPVEDIKKLKLDKN